MIVTVCSKIFGRSIFEVPCVPCRSLKDGGILVLELGHPRDIFQGNFCSDGFVECWEVSASGRVEFADEYSDDGSQDATTDDIWDQDELDDDRVLVEYGREGDSFDISSQVLQRTVGMSLFTPDGSMASTTVHTVAQRQFTLQEICILAQASGFEVLKVLGDFDPNILIDNNDAHRMLAVLRKL